MNRATARAARRMFVAVLLGVFALAALPTIAFSQDASTAKSLEGKWEGALGSGEAKLRVIVTISKNSSGEYSGSLNSVDQGVMLPMSGITLEGDVVRFELKTVGGAYHGTLSKDGAEITGTWTQTAAPNPQPLSLTRQVAGTGSQTSAAPTGPTTRPLSAPLDITIPIAPTAFQADGKWHLAYELHVANLGRWDAELTHLSVLAADPARKSLADFTSADLEGIVVHPGRADVTPNAKIPPGAFAVAYMWVTVNDLAEVPASIVHRIAMKIGTYAEELTIDTPASTVDRKPVVVIGAPLAGEYWVAANGPSNTSGHRRALIELDGRGYISQRFAIDWVELYPDGKTYQGDPADNKNYRAYGAEIHSVADGVVTEVKDGIPQNVPGANSRAVPVTLETIGGNHVIMKIGDGLFAFYAHIQPGSLRVKVGDRVHRGQVIGLVGNTGNSTEPHLHFHICNASSMLACEGLPYAFASFEAQGVGEVEAADKIWKPSESHAAPVKHEMEIPTEKEVVRFPRTP
jgi:hypothetical protein